MTGYDLIAREHGTCSCGKYVRAGVSKITAVAVPMPPDPDVCWYSAERRQWFIDNAPGNTRPRKWQHAICAERFEGLSFDELEMLAADRRQELATIKRRAERGEAQRGRRGGKS